MTLRLLLASFFTWWSCAALAAPVKTPHVEAELIARHRTAAPGMPIEAALRLKIIDHWHTYWRNPGDSGLPTKLKWKLPPGFTAGDIQWPAPKKLPLGTLMNFGYEGEVLHLVRIDVPRDAVPGKSVTLAAKAEWLVCADVCIPEEAQLSLTLPVAAGTPAVDPHWTDAFTRAHAALPRAGVITGVTARIRGATLTLETASPAAQSVTAAFFYPYRDNVIANAAPQMLEWAGGAWRLHVPLAEPIDATLADIAGVIVAEGGTWDAAGRPAAIDIIATVSHDPAAGATSAPRAANGAKPAETPPPALSLALALVFALLGGMVLNLMPCVFPVLGIKVMGFVENAHGEAALLRRQGFAFLAGVLLSFVALAVLMLALRAAGEAIGWGFQLQEPGFVAALALLFFAMGLNLVGVFEWGAGMQALGGTMELRAQRNPAMGAFASGVLATVVATPCMAPGLGAAVGFTLSQPWPLALLVFVVIGLGLALPVVALSLMPGWVRRLPRPGAWMETFKQAMAFPLFGTVVWLTWVLGTQTSVDGVARLLGALTLLAAGAWVYGRWQMRQPLRATAAALVLALAAIGAAGWAARAEYAGAPPAAGGAKAWGAWEPFSPSRIAELRQQGKAVFVDFTASWCITCQVNKRVALNDPVVIKHMDVLGIVRMQADWTRKDETITQALAAFGRNGVPLYVYYPSRGEPKILPEVLTPAIVIAATSEPTAR